MADYNDIGLNDRLQAKNSPIVKSNQYTNDLSNYDLEVITANKTKTASFNGLQGGTAVLGGTVSGNGVLRINNQAGIAMVTVNGTTVRMLDASENTAFLLDYNQEVVNIKFLLLGGTLIGSQSGQLAIRNNANTFLHSFAEDQAIIRTDLLMGTHNFIQLGGTTTPGTPVDAAVRLYVDQSGGKDRLMARFNTGAAQQIGIEP